MSRPLALGRLVLASATSPHAMSRTLAVVLAAAAVSAVLGICWWVQSARPGRRWQTVLILLLLGALFAEMLLDLYGPVRRFWSNDAIWADTVSSAVVAGLIFMAWTYRAARAAQRRADGLSSIGLGAVVDHLVDVEMALSLLTAGGEPRRQAQGKGPLGWLDRDARADPNRMPGDPRRDPVTAPQPIAWRADLVDESLRRLMVGMRNWTPLISTSDDGIEFLLRLSGLRQDLMILQALLTEAGPVQDAEPDTKASRLDYAKDPATLLPALLQRLRALTYFAEIASGPRHGEPRLPSLPWQPRSAVLTDWVGTVPAELPKGARPGASSGRWAGLSRLSWPGAPGHAILTPGVVLQHDPHWLAGFSRDWVRLWRTVISEMDRPTKQPPQTAGPVDQAPYGEAFERALSYSAHAHARQFRKGTSTPYVAHLLAVCSLVLENEGDEDQAIAALLHDAPEDLDGEATLAQLRGQFGDRVATLVAALSDTFEHPKPPWRERKERYLATLGEEPAEVLLISLADKVHNAHAILADYRELGDDLWLRFNTKSGEDQLWYYASLAEVFKRRLPGRLADELSQTVEKLAALMVSDG